MKKLRKGFDRFCYAHRGKGIPNLMLYISIGSAIVYIMSMLDKSSTLYAVLCFDRNSILQGQIWRLFTYVFTYGVGSTNILLIAISLFCYYSLGRAMENVWGTFRFNLFYLTGILLMDIFSMVFGNRADVSYLNLSLFLGYATMYPNAHFLLLFIIPVKAWIFAVFDLAITFFDVFSGISFFPYNLFPLVAIANYFLFFGRDVMNLIPLSWQANARRLFRKKPKGSPRPIQFHSAGSYQASSASVKAPYTHRCTVCGRTDITNPDLEFRYCSRCRGYYCYCQDHINNHTHVE